jgi:hypothetical protein
MTIKQVPLAHHGDSTSVYLPSRLAHSLCLFLPFRSGETVELNKVEGERSDGPLDIAEITERQERYRVETYDKPTEAESVTPLDLVLIPKLAIDVAQIGGKLALKSAIVAGGKLFRTQAGTREAGTLAVTGGGSLAEGLGTKGPGAFQSVEGLLGLVGLWDSIAF